MEPLQKHRALLQDLTPEQLKRLNHKLGRVQLTGVGLVAEGLRQCGVQRICGIPGTPVDSLFGEAVRRGIRCIAAHHQSAAAIIAGSANYLTGSLENVVVASAGPAVTNTLTGILVARDNHWPLLVLGGRRSTRDEGAGYFQELDATPIMTPVTKWAVTVRSAADIIPVLYKAIETAISGTPGPVYIDLPEDILVDEAAPVKRPKPMRQPPPAPSEEEIRQAYSLLRSAERPLLCIGEGLRWSSDPGALRAFVEREQLPFITTSLGRGFIPDSHPLCFNIVRHCVQVKSDLVLMAGAWFDWRFRHGAELNPAARVIHVHPEEGELGRNVNPVLAVAGDGGAFLRRLEAESQEAESQAARPVNRRTWLAELSHLRATEATRLSAWSRETAEPMLPQQLFRSLREALPAEAFVVLDGGISLSCGQLCLEANQPLSWLDPGWNGCIGSGIPQALGARLAFPDRPVVAVVGDTSFGLSSFELETAARHNLPLLAIVVNNSGINGFVRQNRYLGADHNERFFAFSDDLRYDQMAQSLGAKGVQITSIDQFRVAVGLALQSRELTCLNVEVNAHAPVPRVW